MTFTPFSTFPALGPVATPPRPPGLYEPTTAPHLASVLSVSDTPRDFFAASALCYATAIAALFEAQATATTPPCTLGHVAAAVTLVAQDTVLMAVARCESAAAVASPLVTVHSQRSVNSAKQLDMIMPDVLLLLAPYYAATDEPTRRQVVAYFNVPPAA